LNVFSTFSVDAPLENNNYASVLICAPKNMELPILGTYSKICQSPMKNLRSPFVI